MFGRAKNERGISHTPGAQIAGEFIHSILGFDFLGAAARGQLTYEIGGQLTDFKNYTKEQAEILKHSLKQLEEILEDTAEINKHLSEIIKLVLKTKSEVNRYIKDSIIAADKYQNDNQVLASSLQNERMLLAADSQSALSLDAAKTRRKLLLTKWKHGQQMANIEANYQDAMAVDTEKLATDALRQKQKSLLSKGVQGGMAGNQRRRNGGWFGWLGGLIG